MEKKEGKRRIPDRELLLILEQDPSRGVEILIEQYSGLLWTLVQNYLDNPEDQKDCVNETFEQFYYNRKRFTPEKGTLSAYLAGMLRNQAITLYRKNSVRKWEELTDEYENGDSQIEKMAENLDLQQALSALKPDELELIQMKYYEGMTVQEIAASLNISYETAKKRHQKTLNKKDVREAEQKAGKAAKDYEKEVAAVRTTDAYLQAERELEAAKARLKEAQKQEDWMGKHHVGIAISWYSQWYEYLTKLYEVPNMPTAEERKKFRVIYVKPVDYDYDE